MSLGDLLLSRCSGLRNFALLFAFLLLVAQLSVVSAQQSNPQPGLTIQQCQSGYTKVLADFNSCVAAIPNPMTEPGWHDWSALLGEMRQILARIAGNKKKACIDAKTDPAVCEQQYQEDLAAAQGYNGPLATNFDPRLDFEFDQNILLKSRYEVAFRGCVQKAASDSKALLGSCRGTTFGQSSNRGLYCAVTKATIATCKKQCIKCYTDSEVCLPSHSCKECDQLETETFAACAPPTASIPVRGGSCSSEYQVVQQALDNCFKLPKSDRAQCRQDALALQATLLDACKASQGSTASPPISSQNGQAGEKADRVGRASGIAVRSDKSKPLPPNPCRDGASCSGATSAGVASPDPSERGTNGSLSRVQQDRSPDLTREPRGRSEIVNDRGRDATPSRIQGDSLQSSRSDAPRSTQSDRPNRSPMDLERMAPMRTETPRLR